MSEAFDVLIVGAGINGAGLFRDLCEQGLRVAIVDKGDFGSGTSAAPSRLIHGGLKYLETGEFGLVAQSTLERNLLLRNAPHLVRPLQTIIPIFSWLNGIGAALRTLFGSTTAPRSRGAVLIKVGLSIYDFYGSRHRVMPRHALWSKGLAISEIPALTPGIVAAGSYFDAAIVHPERLVLELIMDGLSASPGSVALNYAEFLGRDDAILRYRADGTEYRFRPRIVANAAGPWIDSVNDALGVPTTLIGGTKGSHMLLDHPELLRSLGSRMVYFEADDGRICLAYDYLGKALVGSTDIRASDPDTVLCEDDEIDYLLEALRALFPTLAFDRNQIVYAYSGIRPLPASGSGQVGLISRDHSAPVLEPDPVRPWPVISLVGGKWTTFRGFADEVADIVLTRLGRSRLRSTRDMPIGGGRGYPRDTKERADWLAGAARMHGADERRASILLDRYGVRALDALASEAKCPSIPLRDAAEYTEAEIDWLARTERIVTLADLVLRRMTIAAAGRLSRRDLETIARLAATAMGWDEMRLSAELADTVRVLETRHRWQPFTGEGRQNSTKTK